MLLLFAYLVGFKHIHSKLASFPVYIIVHYAGPKTADIVLVGHPFSPTKMLRF